jgi:hypothetical protein
MANSTHILLISALLKMGGRGDFTAASTTPLTPPFSKVDRGVFLKSYLRAKPDHRGRKKERRFCLPLASRLDRRAGAFAGAIIRLLKPVFDIDIEDCPNWGGALKIIAAIEETVVISKILSQPRSPRPARTSELLSKPT